MPVIVTPNEAAEIIQDRMKVGICSFGGWLGADLVFQAIRSRFNKYNSPREISVFSGVLPGNLSGDDVGMNVLAIDGLIGSVTAAHLGMAPIFSHMVYDEKFAAYAVPLGVIGGLLRAAAGRKPGILTKVGLGTFCDPRLEGCAMNALANRAGESPVELMEISGEEYLFYRAPKLDVCILRVSAVDKDGNASTKFDPITAEQLEMALAVRANGGKVIVQADRLVEAGTFEPREVLTHRSLIDYIVLDNNSICPPGYDCRVFRPELIKSGNVQIQVDSDDSFDFRKICGRRGVLELHGGSIANLGIGVPDSVALAAALEGISSQLTLSLESGPLGGVPVAGVGFGASVHPEVIMRSCDTFDYYDGGGLDIAFLGAAEIDAAGNVNVSRFADRMTGPGGFINIAQNTSRVCFLGSFTAVGLKVSVSNGKLQIENEGRSKKFVKKVSQVTFSASRALETGQEVLYITERAVFRLSSKGPELIEIAPGIDIDHDIFTQMDFTPAVSSELKQMDKRIFTFGKMGISK
jgi:propionate CoA-transferase